ncbi:HAD family hydrolase [Micromonospora sp. DT229]|uniref:HAD family hydrolase n=1 Tax=Micromonospora sp. DT229 TaxID=3393430 RepID=UPI003CF2D6F3
MLSTVVFDADETLLDLRPAVTGGLVAVLDEMRRHTPGGGLDELVGDNLAFDVVAAQRAGLRAVWLNRRGESLPPDGLPDAAVCSLAELPAVLVGLSGEADFSIPSGYRSGETSCVDV